MTGALLIDTSHHNALPNFAAFKAGGGCGVIAKASEGTGFADPTFGASRSGAHAAGLLFGAYHFTRLLSPAAEAAWFARCIGGRLRPGEFVGLDLEVAVAGVNPVVWTGQWLDALAALGITVRLLYLNKSELAGSDWSPIARRGVLLWLADYDGAQSAAGVPAGAFGVLTLKQFTSTGTVPGESDRVDVDWSPLSPAQLAAALGGAAPTPAPTVLEDDMRLIRDPNGTVYRWTDTDLTAIADPGFAAVAERAWGGLLDVTAAELAGIEANADACRKKLLDDMQSWILGADPGADPERWLFPRIVDIQAKVDGLQSAPGLACQGNPKAVLSAFAQAAQTAATTA